MLTRPAIPPEPEPEPAEYEHEHENEHEPSSLLLLFRVLIILSDQMPRMMLELPLYTPKVERLQSAYFCCISYMRPSKDIPYTRTYR